VHRTNGYRGAGADGFIELDHELRASLFGIEALAAAFSEQRADVPAAELGRLAQAIASEAQRLRLMLASRDTCRTSFDLSEVIRPAILMTRARGVEVREAVPPGMWVQGFREDAAEVVLALLDNARVHAAPSPVDIRAVVHAGTTTLYIEDRGPGITDIGRHAMFKRGRRGARSSGSGLGLFIARRLIVEQGGSLTAERRPGGGTSFGLSLPSSAPGWSQRPLPEGARPAAAS